jgi:hypothetical protein
MKLTIYVEINMFNGLFCLVLLLGPMDDGNAVVLATGQKWYEEEKTPTQELEGILVYTPATGRVGIPTDYHSFRLIRQEKATGKIVSLSIHVPGQEPIMALNVGQRVKLEGKLVEHGEGDAKTQELWVGRLTPLGAAPANAFTEMKPLARTNQFMPGELTRVRNDLSTLTLRSGDDVARVLGLKGPGADREATSMLANMLGVKTIDWRKEMAISLGMLYTRAGVMQTTKLEVTRLEVNDRGVIVYWKLEQQGGRNGPVTLTETILVPRIEGEVTFKREETKDEVPNKMPMKNIPSATVPFVPRK